MLNRFFTANASVIARRYVVNSANHLQLQAELSDVLSELRKLKKNHESATLLRDVLQKFGEDDLYNSRFVKSSTQNASGLFEKNIQLNINSCRERAVRLVKEIRKECQDAPVVQSAKGTKK